MFDTWGGVLSPAMYREFSLRYLLQIAEALGHNRGPGDAVAPADPVRQGQRAVPGELADSGAEGVGVDWTIGLDDAARRRARQVALQGNLDPAALYANRTRSAQAGPRSTPTATATAVRARAMCSTSATGCRRT